MAANTSHLPPEITEIILSKLPVKPLLRFKSVSKSWNNTISDHVFVRNHHHRSQNSNTWWNLFLRHDDSISKPSSNRFCVVKLGDRKFQRLQVIESTIEWEEWWEEYLCFCEGVLLLSTHRLSTEFTLWNPSTRTHRKISHPYSGWAAFGLCHDPTTDDFKVVIVHRNHYSVYSCGNKSWIVLKNEYEIEHTGVGQLATSAFTRAVCVDGASYWILWFQHESHIVYFDPRDDKFNFLQMPENAKYPKWIMLVELRGSLCMYCKVRDDTTIRIWTKEKGIDNSSWNELMTVENVDMNIWFRPLCFVENKMIVRNSLSNRLHVYSPSEKRFEEFEEETRVFGTRDPIPYMESLFFPH